MRKKCIKRLLGLALTAAVLTLAPAPEAAEAAVPTMEGHGLSGAWYKAKEGADRNDITRSAAAGKAGCTPGKGYGSEDFKE